MEMVTLQIQMVWCLTVLGLPVQLFAQAHFPQVKTIKEEPKECWQKGDFKLFAWRGVNSVGSEHP